jgi:SAM-dependent methyltransferase
MSAENWNKPELVAKWVELSKNNGDICRQFLVNPIIFELLSGTKDDHENLLYQAFAGWFEKFGDNLKRDGNEIHEDWYLQWSPEISTTILDLGCGEGYRGSWLGTNRAKYVGVDVSTGLLDAARLRRSTNTSWLEADLDDPNSAIAKIQKEYPPNAPPNWVFAITLIDHLAQPEELLRAVADMYDYTHKGRMLVVTCNPLFYRSAQVAGAPNRVRIASVRGDAGKVDVYLRSTAEMRRLFRDCGLQIVDEASPLLPFALANLGDAKALQIFDSEEYNLAYGPLNFWLLELQGTRREPVEAGALEKQRERFAAGPREAAVAAYLLNALQGKENSVWWRYIGKNSNLVRPHNLGGRLFIVESGALELRGPVQLEGTSRSSFRFNPGDIIGELEILRPEDRHSLYSAAVCVSESQSAKFAKVLEVPYAVVHEQLLTRPELLANPFLHGLKRKLLRSLLQPNSRLITERSKDDIKACFDGRVNLFSENNLKTKHIQLVASVIAQGLEAERERVRVEKPLVVIHDFPGVIHELYSDKQNEERNAALHFLAQAGIIRRAAPYDSLQKNSSSDATTPGRKILQPYQLREQEVRSQVTSAIKRILDKDSEWIRKHEGNPQAAAIASLRSTPTECLFIVDDEFMLRRCVLEPDRRWFPILVDRVLHFGRFEQPAKVKAAMVNDFVDLVAEQLPVRFSSSNWAYDSIGWPITAKEKKLGART